MMRWIFDLLGYNLSLPYESYQEICERKQITLRKLDPETNVRKQLATVRSMFGPEGMSRNILDENGEFIILSSGATYMKVLNIFHPVAKTLVESAELQDAKVGDGATSVVLLADELLNKVKPIIEGGVRWKIVIGAVEEATGLCVKKIKEFAVHGSGDGDKWRNSLEKCAAAALCWKLTDTQKEFLSKMVVDAIHPFSDSQSPLNRVIIKEILGDELEASELIDGVVIKNRFPDDKFKMRKEKEKENYKIALLKIILEIKGERKHSDFVDIEAPNADSLKAQLDKIRESGAEVVLSNFPIGGMAKNYFARHDIFCVDCVPEEDLERMNEECGGYIITTTVGLKSEDLAICAPFQEEQIGGERFNIFKGCNGIKTRTIILRSIFPFEQIGYSLHSAIKMLHHLRKDDSVVAGGGAIEMKLSKMLRDHSSTNAEYQSTIKAVAEALEIIPRQLCDNAGFETPKILKQLRQKHEESNTWFGVNYTKDVHIADNFAAFVWEPAVVKVHALQFVCGAVCQILSASPQDWHGEGDESPSLSSSSLSWVTAQSRAQSSTLTAAAQASSMRTATTSASNKLPSFLTAIGKNSKTICISIVLGSLATAICAGGVYSFIVLKDYYPNTYAFNSSMTLLGSVVVFSFGAYKIIKE